ncbi:MAG: ribonuclease P protein component [Candidatus Jorgensenbacteria bacterium]|nr:ribonuclease P protein component [Candidatus Jorgensenbacteria bacterium]
MAEKQGPLVIIKKNPSGFQKKPLLITVGKNVAKKATQRNLIKRRIRAIIKKTTLLDAGDITVITKPGADKMSFAELKSFIVQ